MSRKPTAPQESPQDRIARITAALLFTAEGQGFMSAISGLHAHNTFVPVYEMRGAEGTYTLLGSSRPDLVEAYREASGALDAKARELGATRGDTFGISMSLEDLARKQAPRAQETISGGLARPAGYSHSPELPKAQERLAPAKKAGIVWDPHKRAWRRIA